MKPAPPVTRARMAGQAYRQARSSPRSHSTVCAIALAHADLRLPAEQALGLADVGPAAHDVDLERRQVLERERARGPRRTASQMTRAISATVISSPAEMLKSSFRPGGRGHRGDDAVGDVVDVGERPRLRAVAEDLQRLLARQHLLDDVGDHVRDARLVLGHLARPVGVERAADRVRQAVLVVRGAAVDLAGELGEPVGRLRDRRVPDVLLGRRVLRRALEDHRARDVDEALDVVVERRADDAVVERVVHLGQRVRELVEVRDAADDRREVDDVRAAVRSPRAPARRRAGRRCGPRSPRASTAAPRAGRRRGPPSRGRAAAAARPRRRSCRRRR